jgi:hypothetical protein
MSYVNALLFLILKDLKFTELLIPLCCVWLSGVGVFCNMYEHYLETAVSVAQPFLHGANMPHCSLLKAVRPE